MFPYSMSSIFKYWCPKWLFYSYHQAHIDTPTSNHLPIFLNASNAQYLNKELHSKNTNWPLDMGVSYSPRICSSKVHTWSFHTCPPLCRWNDHIATGCRLVTTTTHPVCAISPLKAWKGKYELNIYSSMCAAVTATTRQKVFYQL